MSKSEKFWDKQAERFAQEGDGDDVTLNTAVSLTQKYLKQSDVVLDFGCATGALTFTIAGQVQLVEGVDISSKMIALAQQKATERQLANVHFTQGTIVNMPYPDESFDVVLAFNVLHLVEEAQSALRKMNQLLKPGGLFISATPCLGEKGGLFTAVFSLMSKTGLAPQITKFKSAELQNLVRSNSFQIEEMKILAPEYAETLLVARKI